MHLIKIDSCLLLEKVKMHFKLHAPIWKNIESLQIWGREVCYPGDGQHPVLIASDNIQVKKI